MTSFLPQGCGKSKFNGVGKAIKTGIGTDSSGAADPDDKEAAPTPDQTAKAAGNTDSSGVVTLSAEAQCLLTTAEIFNFVFIFDVSSSTKVRDPKNVRRSGSLSFAERLGKLALESSKLDIRATALSFNRTATSGGNGWVKLGSPAAVPSLDQDITKLTADEAVGTHFDEAFKLGDTLLGIRNATADPKQRNYFVVMSDGQANGSQNTKDELQKLVNPIVVSRGLAVISIAAGSNLISSGKDKMNAIALPTTGMVAPDHVGRYYEAPSNDEMTKAWDDFYKSITTCRSQGKAP